MYHKFIRIICAHCGEIYEIPVYCGDRFCSVCSVGRLLRIRQRLNFLSDNIKPPPGFNIKFLTLTIKNQQDLAAMTRTIVNCFRKLRQTRSWKHHVRGGAFVLEITGNSGDWHVHLHIIIEARYYKWAEILKLWMKISPGRGVWIEDIPKRQITRYLSKYLTKTSTSLVDRVEMNDALRGTRLFSPFGTWYAMNLTYEKPPLQCRKCPDPCFILYTDLVEDASFTYEREIPP